MADISTLLASLSSLFRRTYLATLGNPTSVQLNQDIGDTGCIAGEVEAPDRIAFTGA